MLRQAGADEARILVFAMDQDQLSREELETALKTFRQAAVFVRAFDRRTLMRYKGLDVALVVRELFESAIVMGRKVLDTLGIEEKEITRIECSYRARDKERLAIQADKGLFSAEATVPFTPNTPLQENEA